MWEKGIDLGLDARKPHGELGRWLEATLARHSPVPTPWAPLVGRGMHEMFGEVVAARSGIIVGQQYVRSSPSSWRQLLHYCTALPDGQNGEIVDDTAAEDEAALSYDKRQMDGQKIYMPIANGDRDSSKTIPAPTLQTHYTHRIFCPDTQINRDTTIRRRRKAPKRNQPTCHLTSPHLTDR